MEQKLLQARHHSVI